MSKREAKRITLVIAVFWLVMLLAGSLFDLQISVRLYTPNEPLSLVVSTIGVYLFNGSFVFLIGALLRQIISSKPGKIKLIIAIIICTYLAISTSSLGVGGLFNGTVLGSVVGIRAVTFKQMITKGFLYFFPLYPIGILLNGKHYEKESVLRIICVLTTMTISFYSMLLVKQLDQRPRFYITLMGYEGIGFREWYTFKRISEETCLKFGLTSDDLGSFYSGHALQAMLNVLIFPCFSCVFPVLRNRDKVLVIIAVSSSVLISLSRIVLGAHYLSDVAFGSLVGIFIIILFNFFYSKIKPLVLRDP
ncbi:MAG: phosphatase PAP2 family protein [Clostridiales bacterium]|nr:phosphatase PAP2 family protein [Clostridiales bacterium]